MAWLHRGGPAGLFRRAARAPLAASVAVAAVLVSLYVVVFPLASAHYPPITDLPFHATAISILRHYEDPSFHFREQFSLHFLEVPYISMYALGALYALFFPIAWATKLTTITLLLLLPAGLSVMLHGMRKSPLLGISGLVLVWNGLTHWGFINFVAAIGLFCMTVGFTLLVLDRSTPARQMGLALSLLFVFLTHIFRFPFALAAIAASAVFMAPAARRLRPLILPVLPALGAFGVWLVVRPKELSSEGMGTLRLHFERLSEIKHLLFYGFVGTEERRLAEVSLTALAAVFAACLLAFAVERRWRRWSPRDAWWVFGSTFIVLGTSAVFLGSFLVLPIQMGVWWYVYPREIVAAAFVLLGATPDLPRSWLLRLPLLGVIAYAAAGQASFVAERYAAFDAQTADFRQIVRHLPQAPKLGYMVWDRDGAARTSPPFLHLPAWVQAEKGGWLSFQFIAWNASPIRYHERGGVVPPPTPLRFEWTPERFDMKTRGRFFDWFLVRRVAGPDARLHGDPSLKLVDHVGAWWLYRRKP